MTNSKKGINPTLTSLFQKANKKARELNVNEISNSIETSTADYEKVAAWFLGPKAENTSYLKDCINYSIEAQNEYRTIYYKEGDPAYIDDSIKASLGYEEATKRVQEVQRDLLERLKGSAPFFSLRYQAHMNWDTVLPGSIGYFTAMLYNQNNVASEGGPATCLLEKEVGEDLCKLIGFKETSWGDSDFDTKHGQIIPWSHITADGTIANLESMWASRNFKFYPLALYKTILENPRLKNAYLNLMVNIMDTNGNPYKKKFTACSNWELLNLSCDSVLRLSMDIQDLCNIGDNELSELL